MVVFLIGWIWLGGFPHFQANPFSSSCSCPKPSFCFGFASWLLPPAVAWFESTVLGGGTQRSQVLRKPVESAPHTGRLGIRIPRFWGLKPSVGHTCWSPPSCAAVLAASASAVDRRRPAASPPRGVSAPSASAPPPGAAPRAGGPPAVLKQRAMRTAEIGEIHQKSCSHPKRRHRIKQKQDQYVHSTSVNGLPKNARRNPSKVKGVTISPLSSVLEVQLPDLDAAPLPCGWPLPGPLGRRRDPVPSVAAPRSWHGPKEKPREPS